MGRMVGGSTAVNGGTCFRTPSAVLDRWCEEMCTDEFSRDAMRPYFERVEHVLQTQPASRQHIGKISDVFQRGCDALGWSHFAIVRNAPGWSNYVLLMLFLVAFPLFTRWRKSAFETRRWSESSLAGDDDGGDDGEDD